jgi:hypothetical protein
MGLVVGNEFKVMNIFPTIVEAFMALPELREVAHLGVVNSDFERWHPTPPLNLRHNMPKIMT